VKHTTRKGRPRTRNVDPNSSVLMTFSVTAAERDEMLDVFGSGNVSGVLRRAARAELSRAKRQAA
jgi:hypothetical protein